MHAQNNCIHMSGLFMKILYESCIYFFSLLMSACVHLSRASECLWSRQCVCVREQCTCLRRQCYVRYLCCILHFNNTPILLNKDTHTLILYTHTITNHIQRRSDSQDAHSEACPNTLCMSSCSDQQERKITDDISLMDQMFFLDWIGIK